MARHRMNGRTVSNRALTPPEDAAIAGAGFAGRMFRNAEALRVQAMEAGDLSGALDALELQYRIARTYGVPPEALTDDDADGEETA